MSKVPNILKTIQLNHIPDDTPEDKWMVVAADGDNDVVREYYDSLDEVNESKFMLYMSGREVKVYGPEQIKMRKHLHKKQIEQNEALRKERDGLYNEYKELTKNIEGSVYNETKHQSND